MFLHVNIVKLHVDIYILYVNIFISHVDIFDLKKNNFHIRAEVCHHTSLPFFNSYNALITIYSILKN